MIQTQYRLSLNRRTPHAEFKKRRSVSVIPSPSGTTSHESMVVLISKHLHGCFCGNTPYSSGCRAWLDGLNLFNSNGFHSAAIRFRALLDSSRPPFRHTLLPTLVVRPVKAS